MPILEREKEYLKSKHRGGLSNSEGNSYENYYAVYCMALMFSKFINDLDNVHFSSQIEDCFVDDLLVTLPNKGILYHQIKNVQKFSWNYLSLKRDFERQMQISTERDELFHLNLVYSNKDNKERLLPIPYNIKKVTRLKYFPFVQNINNLYFESDDFKSAFQNINHSGKVNDDELIMIAQAFLGTWVSSDQQNISLKCISDNVRKFGKGFLNLKSFPNVTISDKCAEFFTKNKLSFSCRGIRLYWSTADERLSGNVEWTKELENRILKSQPSDLWSLISLLN